MKTLSDTGLLPKEIRNCNYVPRNRPCYGHTKLLSLIGKIPLKDIIKKAMDEFLSFYYNTPCSGCPEGHASFWKTIIESPQWEAWKKVGHYDFAECEELGVCSKKHFRDFLKFIKENKFGK